MRTKCPHCEAYARHTKSSELDITCKEITFRCTNDDCGHVFVATLSATRTLVPSARPNMKIRLPFSKNVNAEQMARYMEQNRT